MAQEIPRHELYEVFRDAIQDRVCRVCLDQADSGRCSLAGRDCVLETQLPRVVEAMTAVNSERMDAYVDAIREGVCARCSEEDAEGHCDLRRQGECALDTYLPLVAEAVEDVVGPLRS